MIITACQGTESAQDNTRGNDNTHDNDNNNTHDNDNTHDNNNHVDASVFERLAKTPIHHLTEHISHEHDDDDDHNPDTQSHNLHHQIKQSYDKNNNPNVESVFDRLSKTPIHHLTSRERQSIQSYKGVASKRITHSNLNVGNRKGFTPERGQLTSGTVAHAVVLITKVPALVDVQQEVLAESQLSTLGAKDCSLVSTAMLSDIIGNISKLKEENSANNKLIVAIPDVDGQLESLNMILDSLSVKPRWSVLTIPNAVPSLKDDTVTDNLTELMKYTLQVLGPCLPKGSISFLASDCPTLSLNEIKCGQSIASEDGNFYIAPAEDGGYCLLSIPSNTPQEAFDNVMFASNDTCIQQILSLRKVASQSPLKKKQTVIVGRTHRDIDSIDDINYLKQLIKGNDDSPLKGFPKTISILNKLKLN